MFARITSSSSLRTFKTCQTQAIRRYAVQADEDVRAKLTEGLKAAMKAKDTARSTVVRSMLSEVYNLDKKKAEKQATPAIQDLIRKAVKRRKDAANQYQSGARPDLAEKEIEEAAMLEDYLPALMPIKDMDRILQEVIMENNITMEGSNANLVLGKVFKAFYAKVNRQAVDSEYVKKRAGEMLGPSQ